MNRNTDRNTNHHDLHAQLCAYHLDELDDDARAQVERLLADDASARDKLARIESTVAVIQGAFPSERLSDDRREQLVAAAARTARPTVRFGWRPAMAAAALVGVAVALGSSQLRPERGGLMTLLDSEQAGEPSSDATSTGGERRSFAETAPETQIHWTPDGVDASIQAILPDANPAATKVDSLGEPIHVRFGAEVQPAIKTDVPFVASEAPPDGEGMILRFDWSPQSGYKALTAQTQAEAELRRLQLGRTALASSEEARVAVLARRAGEPDPNTRPGGPLATLRESLAATAGSAAPASPAPLTTTPPPTPTTATVTRHRVAPTTTWTPATATRRGRGAFDQPVAVDADSVLEQCRRRPDETPSMMFFRFWGDNPFERAALDAQSTFGVDVDTASYALMRRYLNSGHIPEKAAIRTEEFLNYFRPDLPPPADGAVFAIHVDGAPSLFGGDRTMLRVGLRGREVAREERLPQRLTFVVDTSGSMKKENRLELVKHGLRLLLTQLDGRDSIALIAFSTEARLVLPMTSAAERPLIEAAIHGLSADGNTNAEAGLKLGYELAAGHTDPEAVSRVVLLSDGVANVGETDQDRIADDVAHRREEGIYLNTIGVGLGNHNDLFLEQLADRGDGLCNYIDSEDEARRALVENFTGAFVPIARDVKMQVTFDPERVLRYRLLGYENRAIADADFRDDAVDAGEIGSGHQVVALYEVELDDDVSDGVLCSVDVRYKPPKSDGDEVTELHAELDATSLAGSYSDAPPGFRRALLVAQFAELLRRSTHAAGDSLDLLLHEAKTLEEELGDPDFTEFVALVDRSRALIAAQWPADDPLTDAIDAVRRNAHLRAELEDLARDEDERLLDELEEENRRLEERIRELLKRRLGR